MALAGKICLVTGASRGIGKGVALQLGEAGATVYITGRTLKLASGGQEGSLIETAKEIEKRGGKCISVQCDHSKENEIKALFERLAREQNGQLDLLVNNAYAGGSMLVENFNKPFWEVDSVAMWDSVNNVGLRNHYICAAYAARLMVGKNSGLIINMSSAGGLRYIFNVAYGVGKEACDRMAADCAVELRRHNVAFISLWPGAINTEFLASSLDTFIAKLGINKDFLTVCSSPEYIGKVVVHLCKESSAKIMKRSGRICIADDVANMYSIKDIDGKRPLNMRCVKVILIQLGYSKLAKWIPSWIKIPTWIMALGGIKF